VNITIFYLEASRSVMRWVCFFHFHFFFLFASVSGIPFPNPSFDRKHLIMSSISLFDYCSAGKCRIAGKRHNLRKMSHRRRKKSQSAENVVNPTTGICRIVDGKCRKKIRCRYMSQHRREMSQLLLILHFDDFELICDYNEFY